MSVSAEVSRVNTARLTWLDLCRGLICVTMAIDHGTYLLWSGARESSFLSWYGPFTSDESVAETFIRLGSSLCAPGFFFLMGCGITFFAVSRQRMNWSGKTIVRHLALRGLVLIALQFCLENLLWSLKPNESWFNYVGVMYALGISMILSAAMWNAQKWALGSAGFTLIILPELFAPYFRGSEMELPLLVALAVLAGKSHGLIIYFSALPWSGLCLLGILFGRLLTRDVTQGLRWAGVAGPLAVFGGLAIRFFAGAGNLGVVQGHGWAGFLTFVKYSPSLAFTLWNIGWVLTLCVVLSKLWELFPNLMSPLNSYGRSPLFFYFSHIGLFAVLSRFIGAPGLNLHLSLGLCVLGLLFLWPLCRCYSQFKVKNPLESWWRYF